jgi:DNA mismatch endonuclease (patch repair protein)
MPDVFSKAKRSEVMSRIRSRGNRDTELALAHLLRAHKISGWRRHVRVAVESSLLSVERKRTSPRPSPRRGEGEAHSVSRRSSLVSRLSVRPDFVFRKSRTAIFVDGCFWHGCPRHATWPAHRAAWWRRKIEGNKTRDRLVNRMLRRAGWRVVRIWEHELQMGKHPTLNIQHPTSNRRQKGEPSRLVERTLKRIEKHLK